MSFQTRFCSIPGLTRTLRIINTASAGMFSSLHEVPTCNGENQLEYMGISVRLITRPVRTPRDGLNVNPTLCIQRNLVSLV